MSAIINGKSYDFKNLVVPATAVPLPLSIGIVIAGLLFGIVATNER